MIGTAISASSNCTYYKKIL